MFDPIVFDGDPWAREPVTWPHCGLSVGPTLARRSDLQWPQGSSICLGALSSSGNYERAGAVVREPDTT